MENIQSEPIDAKRRIPIRLLNGVGDGVAGQTGLVTLTIMKEAGAWGAPNVATTITEDAGAADGDYTINHAIGDWDTVGILKYKITGPNTKLFAGAILISPNAGSGRMRYGKAQGGAVGSVQLDAGASAANDFYAGNGKCCVVIIVAGTGAGQARLGVSYVGASRTVGVAPNFVTAPDATSIVETRPYPGQLDATVIAAIQAGLATDAHVLAIPVNPLATNDARLNNLNASIAAIPTTPLLANDARIAHLDADISSRAATGAAMALTAGERNATADAIIARPIGAPGAGSVGAAILAGGGGGGGGGATAQQILDTIFEGPNQYDGNGEALPQGGVLADYNVTIAQGLREILAYCSGSATQLNGVNPIIKSRVGLRNRIVAQMNNGNRTVTSRNNT